MKDYKEVAIELIEMLEDIKFPTESEDILDWINPMDWKLKAVLSAGSFEASLGDDGAFHQVERYDPPTLKEAISRIEDWERIPQKESRVAYEIHGILVQGTSQGYYEEEVSRKIDTYSHN